MRGDAALRGRAHAAGPAPVACPCGSSSACLSPCPPPLPSPPPPSPLPTDQVKKPSNPIALRLSGHLLVGLSRIYAKKVQYLLHDSGEALHNLTVSHKAKAVDVDYEGAEEDPAALNRASASNSAK